MTQFVFANNVNTTLASAVSNTATSVALASSANLPTLSAGQVMPLTLNDAATGQVYEIMYVTAISGPTLTVTRAQEGTGAQNWNTGDYAFCAFTAQGTATATGNPNNPFMTGPATTANQAPQFGQISGVVGQSRNLSMSVATASATATLTADEIIVESALGGLRYCLPSFSKTINLGTTGAGGMDTGSAPASGFVAIYAIYNATSGASALLATNATSSKVGNVYGGANMPTGYTASALLTVWRTNSSSQFGIGLARNRRVSFPGIVFIAASTNPSGYTSASLATSLAAPPNAVTVAGYGSCSGSVTTGGQAGWFVATDANGTGAQGANGYEYSGVSSIAPFNVDINTSQTVYWNGLVTSGTPIYSIQATSYWI